MSFAFRFVIQSNVGVIRKSNEDCGLGSPYVVAVADGMGGHAAGEVASATVIQTVKDHLNELPGNSSEYSNWLISTTNLAHSTIGDLIAADSEKRGMGTTFSTIAVLEDKIGIGHIGDSRIYRLRDGELKQVSVDHTYVQSLVDSGEITAEEAAIHPRRNLLIRAIDGIHDVAMDIDQLDAELGDRFLLCSDGLTGVISDGLISQQLQIRDQTVAVAQLIEFALAAGAPDNVTVAICEVINDDALLNDGTAPIVVGAIESNENSTVVTPRISKSLVLKIAAIVVLLLSSVFAANTWINNQWFIGVNDGNVSIYQGIDQELGPVSLNHLVMRTDLPFSSLSQNDSDAVSHGISITDLNSGLTLIEEMMLRSLLCEDAQDVCIP
jgi:protein phosphatase